MRTILFEEREVVIRKAMGSFPEVKKATTELEVIRVVDTGIDIRAFLSVDNISFCRVLSDSKDYKPLVEWSEVDVNNKIMDLL